MRLYDGGFRVEKRVRQVQRTRGHFTIEIEKIGRRLLLVAQLQPASGYGRIPHLHGVELIGTSSSCWVLDGHERLEAGPMRKECLIGQTWLVEPAYEDDLISVENRLLDAVREANALRAQLTALNASALSLNRPPPDGQTSKDDDESAAA